MRKYPYLGRHFVDGKPYVVLFLEEETGVIVMNGTDSKNLRFGKLCKFDEDVFEVLPPDECVRLSN